MLLLGILSLCPGSLQGVTLACLATLQLRQQLPDHEPK